MAVDDMWEHDRFEGGGGRGGGGVNLVGRALASAEGGAKLLISNLHHAVTQPDVKARAGAHRACHAPPSRAAPRRQPRRRSGGCARRIAPWQLRETCHHFAPPPPPLRLPRR